jgi:hypothetical protein
MPNRCLWWSRGRAELHLKRELVLFVLTVLSRREFRELVPGASRELLRKVDSVVANRCAGSQRTNDHLGLSNGLTSGRLYHSPR